MRERCQSLFMGTFVFGCVAMLAACEGDPGSPGTDGANALVDSAPEPAGANCPFGGTKITVGIAATGTGLLDAAEVRPTGTSYACNGRGTASLIKTSQEPSGASCPRTM